MRAGATRLGFRYRAGGAGIPLTNACDSIPLYIPVANDSYALSQLGTPDNTMATIANGYIQYTVNGGPGQGQIGNGSTSPGIRFDPTGAGNYGNDDYIRPGTPYEVFGFYVSNTTWIGGDNSNSHNNWAAGDTLMWNKSAGNLSHVICRRGNTNNGYVVVQYQTYAGESLIRMKMSYTNTTGLAVTLKAYRGCDPDVGAIQYGTYNTYNYRGYGSIPASNIVVAEETNTNKPIALYIPGNGYTHNTSILSSWPSQAVDTMLTGFTSGNGDYAMFGAWDFGTVAAGATVYVCCYYVLGTDIGSVLNTIT